MSILLKQAVGIDIAAENFTACIASMDQDQNLKFSSVKSFSNSLKGFTGFKKWVRQNTEPAAKIIYLMEATGVYYENLAYYLLEENEQVSVILPNKINYYSKVIDSRSKTDIIDAKLISAYGVERKLEPWKPTSSVIRAVKQLTREREQLVKERTRLRNQLHSVEASYNPLKTTQKRLKKHIIFLDNQIEVIEQEIQQLVKTSPELEEKVKKVTTIPGVGLLTALIIIAETNGFALFENRRQLVRYAGYDVVENQSGSSLKGKAKISKKGNRHIRKALHMPSLNAKKYNPPLAKFYDRLLERKSQKMVGVVAVQRKLLLLIYAIWKNDGVYDPNYNIKNEVAKSTATSC